MVLPRFARAKECDLKQLERRASSRRTKTLRKAPSFFSCAARGWFALRGWLFGRRLDARRSMTRSFQKPDCKNRIIRPQTSAPAKPANIGRVPRLLSAMPAQRHRASFRQFGCGEKERGCPPLHRRHFLSGGGVLLTPAWASRRISSADSLWPVSLSTMSESSSPIRSNANLPCTVTVAPFSSEARPS